MAGEREGNDRDCHFDVRNNHSKPMLWPPSACTATIPPCQSRLGQDYTGGLRVFLRDDWPFAGTDPQVAIFPYIRDQC